MDRIFTLAEVTSMELSAVESERRQMGAKIAKAYFDGLDFDGLERSEIFDYFLELLELEKM